MDYDTFKLIHSELIMSMQYIEQDLKIIYATLKSGNYDDNFKIISEAPLGKVLIEFRKLDSELGYQKIKEKDYELLDEIREIRNYWCHQCYLDFHYYEDPEEHAEAFIKVAEKLHFDELRVYDLQQRIEKFRIATVKKHNQRNCKGTTLK